MRWAPVVFLPSQIHGLRFPFIPEDLYPDQIDPSPVVDVRLTPHYPTKTPLDDLLGKVDPGTDEYVTEKYAAEIMGCLSRWTTALKTAPPALGALAQFVHATIEATPFSSVEERLVRSDQGIQVVRRQFERRTAAGRERFLQDMQRYLADMAKVETAEFDIAGIEETVGSPAVLRVGIRYEFVGEAKRLGREQRLGSWLTHWARDAQNGWQVFKWEFTEEVASRAREPIFIDITSRALGQIDSYNHQMLRGTDYWRTVLDGACGIDVYGNNGLAVGDIDNDGYDDLYVCQPSGLPNRLYRNRGDGTFEDVTEKWGVGVLDNTSCALFADFENKGLQDLLVVCGSGPLLFLNQGNGKYSIKRDAFRFARPPQGTFTQAAVADYDRDGRLDIYFCLYNYYVGLDQYHYPVPYFDARNGPPNFLLHNEGNATFEDRTEAAGLNVDNDRYSFACAWGDSNRNGWPDLYVANDFGRNNLYRNNGDGTLACVSAEAGVEDAGAGMSACWFDFDNDGGQDIYVADMWSSAGLRVSQQRTFQERTPERIRALYRQHSEGNSLYRNQGKGRFENASRKAGVDVGRWAWSSDAWDFDHDGYTDLYIANGYISGPDARDVSSFFWRYVVGKSPQNSTPSSQYEQGWNAINELIRSDASWSGRERNVFYLNNRDGTFSDVSGVVGLDFPEDSRSFALADLDHDGRLEIVLKNRNAPQLRVLRNAIKELGDSIAIRLRGTKSNRDAIGAAVTVEVGAHHQTKYLQAGSGFLSQHTKELFFGLGKQPGSVRASIQWPSGLTQSFESVPANHRIEIEEGSKDFAAKPFASSSSIYSQAGDPQKPELLPTSVETWLLEPLNAPDFSLPDLTGKVWNLRSLRGGSVLLNFWTTSSAGCIEQMKSLQRYQSKLAQSGLRILAVNVDDPLDPAAARSLVSTPAIPFPILLATRDVSGIYNIIYRYLFDRRRDMAIPTSLLIDPEGLIVKVYQGHFNPELLLADTLSLPTTAEARTRMALPFSGTVYQGTFQRNDFTYGVALFQRGYLDHAAASFQQVIASKPEYPEAYYNLGTLELRRNAFRDARKHLEQAVKLRSNYPEAWNNLGMISAQEGQADEAIRNFQQSLLLRPDYVTALLNLGNVYRRQRDSSQAEKNLSRALEIEPENPEVHYSLGMLSAQQDELARASSYFEQAVSLRPGYADALNNLGIVLIRQQRYAEAEERFKTCVQVAPGYDQAYLNLARLYMMRKNTAKAREVLLALLQHQPQNKVAQQTLEMLH